MATSQNGWAVIDSPSDKRLRKWIIPDTGRHLLLRDGSVGFILTYHAAWWNENIGQLGGGTWDEWAWAKRPVRGSNSGYSNHASGTAIDLNATKHPMGVAVNKTFSRDQINAIRQQIREYDGVLRWGGEWSRPDGMHTEVAPGVNLDRAERVAARLVRTDLGRAVLAANPGAAAVIKSGNQHWKGTDPVNNAPAPVPPPAPAWGALIHGAARDADKAARALLRAFTEYEASTAKMEGAKQARDHINDGIRVLQALPDWPGSKAQK